MNAEGLAREWMPWCENRKRQPVTSFRKFINWIMYNINQLNEMSDDQLRELAKSMGLKRVDSINHDELVFEVLDHQAEAEAANAPEPGKRRRERIRQPAAKANGNEVTKDDSVVAKNKKNNQQPIIIR